MCPLTPGTTATAAAIDYTDSLTHTHIQQYVCVHTSTIKYELVKDNKYPANDTYQIHSLKVTSRTNVSKESQDGSK